MNWIIFLFITILTWGSYNLFFKVIEKDINYFLALLIISITGGIISIPFIISASHSANLNFSSKGYWLAIIMGVLLGVGTVTFFYAFKHGASTSIAVPAYAIGALIIGVVGGVLFFHEAINIRIIIGLILGLISIFLMTYKS